MIIPKAVSGQSVLLVNAFVSQLTHQNTSAAANTLEATFYASLRGGMMQTGRLATWLRGTSISYFNEIQILFNFANIGLIALSAKELLGKIQPRYEGRYGVGTLHSAAVVVAVFLGWKLLNRLSPPLAQPQTLTTEQTIHDTAFGQFTRTHTCDIAEEFSTQQKIARELHFTKLVLNIASACFVENRLWLIVSLATSSYSFWKNIQLKWITFKRTFPYHADQLPISQIKSTYHMLAFLPSQTVKGECPVCYDKVTEAVAFCGNHVFCKTCIVRVVHKKSAHFINLHRIVKTITNHSRNGVHQSTSKRYSSQIDQKNLPHCLLCIQVPLQNTLSMEITDQIDGKFDVNVTVIRPPVDRQ